MSDPTDDDMDQPLTKREFREAVKNDLVTKPELRDMFANFLDAIIARIDASETRLTLELRSQVMAIRREHLDELGKFDEKYKDLPDRVTRLEEKVFTPKRRRTR